MKKYAIFNPFDGQYYYVDTIEECQQKMANIAYNFYMIHSHNSPVSLVEYLEDGSEKWQNVEFTKETIESLSNYSLDIPSMANTSILSL